MMGKWERIAFIAFVFVVQALQFLAVYSIAFLNDRVVEFLFIFFSFQINRKIFGKSYHADQLSKCTLLSLVIFYFLIRGTLSFSVSIFIAPLLGVYLAYMLNYAQELIERLEVPKLFVKRKLREQILEILGDNLDEDSVTLFCTKLGLKHEIAETVFLYLTNSKDEVSYVLGVQGITVIRRLKKFIEVATRK